MQLTESQKKQIAKKVASKAEGMENGIIKVWIVVDGRIKLSEGSMNFRKQDHFLCCVIPVVNEEHPYDENKVLDIIDYLESMDEVNVPSYDVVFNDDNDSNSKGFQETLDACKAYIERGNGTDDSYFPDYKGGSVSIVCNETGHTIYEEEVR